jgi:hypothetical protein
MCIIISVTAKMFVVTFVNIPLGLSLKKIRIFLHSGGSRKGFYEGSEERDYFTRGLGVILIVIKARKWCCFWLMYARGKNRRLYFMLECNALF